MTALFDAGVRQLYSAAETQQLDRLAIERLGTPGIVLMRRAGQAAYRAVLRQWPQTRSLTVCCGRGNNAGDGYVIAGLGASRGLQVQLLQVGSSDALKGDAARARDWAIEQGVVIESFAETAPCVGEVVVDALLGTGIRGEVRPEFAAAIGWINDCGRPVAAVDLPSGLDADTGTVLGCAVRAQLTPTFIACKRGLLTGAGPAQGGTVVFDDLSLPPELFSDPDAPDGVPLLQLGEAPLRLTPRAADAHKGTFGHVLVVGGDQGMGGAVALASEAALRCGAGLVSVATRPAHVTPILARTPEVMAHGVDHRHQLAPLLERASVVVLGPGLGRSPWSEALFDAVLQARLPLILDADGLNLLAQRPQRRDDWVLTPHPGEAARLLATETAEVTRDRFAAVAALVERYGGCALLKGAGTLVAAADEVSLAPYGNPGMAAGGMGDVLSGVLGALLAQGLTPQRAAQLGVCLHGAAADRAVNDGQQGLCASDLMVPLRRLLAEVVA